MFNAADTLIVNRAEQTMQRLVVWATPAAQHVYALAVRQVNINGTINMIADAGLIILGVLLATVFRKYLWARGPIWMKEHGGYDDNPYVVGGYIVLIAGVAIALFGVLSIPSSIASLLNPEWVAIQKLAELIK